MAQSGISIGFRTSAPYVIRAADGTLSGLEYELVMLAATVVAVSSWQHVGYDQDGQNAGGGKRPAERDFMDRMEERWRRRQDDGL